MAQKRKNAHAVTVDNHMTISYTYVMYCSGIKGAESVTATFARPSWWADATAIQRRVIEKQALGSGPVMAKQDVGFRIMRIVRPPCECIVQQVEERDPWLQGAGNTCNRCYGPLP